MGPRRPRFLGLPFMGPRKGRVIFQGWYVAILFVCFDTQTCVLYAFVHCTCPIYIKIFSDFNLYACLIINRNKIINSWFSPKISFPGQLALQHVHPKLVQAGFSHCPQFLDMCLATKGDLLRVSQELSQFNAGEGLRLQSALLGKMCVQVQLRRVLGCQVPMLTSLRNGYTTEYMLLNCTLKIGESLQ